LSYIEGIPDRLPVLDILLADSASNRGDITLVTSTVSQTEVAFAHIEKQTQNPDPDIEASIDSLWADTLAITLIEDHSVIASHARGLIRMGLQHGWSLKPLDAIHLTTAQWFGVSEFHTYDSRLDKYSDHVGFPVVRPYVTGGPLSSQLPLPPTE
jgi:predicted nucleic acid-binding protein